MTGGATSYGNIRVTMKNHVHFVFCDHVEGPRFVNEVSKLFIEYVPDAKKTMLFANLYNLI